MILYLTIFKGQVIQKLWVLQRSVNSPCNIVEKILLQRDAIMKHVQWSLKKSTVSQSSDLPAVPTYMAIIDTLMDNDTFHHTVKLGVS